MNEQQAKKAAEHIYNTFWPEPTTHQEWAEGFNIRDDIRRVLMGLDPM